jgi:hypothetical protein
MSGVRPNRGSLLESCDASNSNLVRRDEVGMSIDVQTSMKCRGGTTRADASNSNLRF